MVGMSRLQRCLLLLVVAAASLASACGPTFCTLLGAEDGLFVDVEVTGGVLPPGEYTIIARAEGVELRVDQMLSADNAVTRTSAPDDVVVDGRRLFLYAFVFRDRGDIHTGFREGAGPDEVTIEVWRGADMLGQETYEPRYREYQPNGEDCPPAVEQAGGSLVIAAPPS